MAVWCGYLSGSASNVSQVQYLQYLQYLQCPVSPDSRLLLRSNSSLFRVRVCTGQTCTRCCLFDNVGNGEYKPPLWSPFGIFWLTNSPIVKTNFLHQKPSPINVLLTPSCQWVDISTWTPQSCLYLGPSPSVLDNSFFAKSVRTSYNFVASLQIIFNLEHGQIKILDNFLSIIYYLFSAGES